MVFPSLASVTDLALMTGRTLTPAQGLQAQALLDQASGIVRAYLQQEITRDVTSLTVSLRQSDPLACPGSARVVLPQRPVHEVTAVTEGTRRALAMWFTHDRGYRGVVAAL